MKEYCISNKVDNEGRIHIPKKFRQKVNFEDNDKITIKCSHKKIFITKEGKSKISKEGKVHIPKKIREKFGIKANCDLLIYTKIDKIELEKEKK